MIQLTPIENDDKKMFHQIALNKTTKNSQCLTCQRDKKICNICELGNRGRMLGMETYVFKRYDLYMKNKKNLECIEQEDSLDDKNKSIIQEAYKSSVLFDEAKQKILANMPRAIKGKCPFCMISEPNTFEHYLPESKYPEYIIFTPNIVPCCSQCNTNKGDTFSINGKRQFIHFYFDDIPDKQFLYADVNIQDGIPVFSFYIKFDREEEINQIIKSHYRRLKLIKRYTDQCNNLVTSLGSAFNFMLQDGKELTECVSMVKYKIKAIRNNRGKNDWEACVLEACIKDIKIFEQIIYYGCSN